MSLHTIRQNFWWILLLVALAAALLFGPAAHYQKPPGDSGKQNSRPTDPWDWKPTRPLY